MRNWVNRVLRVSAVLLLPLGLGACQSLMKPGVPDVEDDGVVVEWTWPHMREAGPRVLGNPTVHSIACDLDHLERHIDCYGSVVPKVPDIWGQARLTVYREQFEAQMAAELGNFAESLQGSVARSDQAFALSATALSFAISGPVATTRFAPGQYGTPDSSNKITQPVQQVVNVPPAVPVGFTATKDEAGNVIKYDALDPGFLFNTGGTTFQPGNFKAAFTTGATKDDKLRISLEPTEYLEQKRRYLDFLAQLRRNSEGDDTADSPGYALNLMRVPVSILPGKKTDVGYGAEITMTISPVLGDDLLPTTFRSLATNDLLQQLGFPTTQLLNDRDPQVIGLLNRDFQLFVRIVTQLNDWISSPASEPTAIEFAKLLSAGKRYPDLTIAFMTYATDDMKRELANLVATPQPTNFVPQTIDTKMKPAMMRAFGPEEVARSAPHLPTSFSVPTIGFATGLDNRTAFPTSQLLDIYGTHAVFEVVFGAWQALQKSIIRQGYAHLPDIQAFLKEEVSAAYELLRKNPQLMHHYCTPDLVQAIRTRRIEEVLKNRQAYRIELACLTGFEPADKDNLKEPYHLSLTAALGWCLIVDSALLTDRLIRDMREAATARGRIPPPAGFWPQYYLPDPPPDARQAFNEYVCLRWPIHVFALDPAIQEQNLADRLATRRELQLALSLAFTSGQMNFNQLNRFARRLEAEYETIELNRTHIGFSHGSDVFGWRFYPRYQTPDTPGNLTLLFRDMLMGGPNKNQLLRQRRLEPGPRECVALVIMPSFVPAVTLDTTSNFFSITNPKHKVFDHTQAVRLGKTVKAITTGGCGLIDAHQYRDGDVARLIKRAEQLEARLPLQTSTVTAPTEGTLGGFEMFGTSTTDLSPEVFGWYGAPGISADGTTPTTLFVVGDHFSPLRTRVIVGNRGLVKDAPSAPYPTDTARSTETTNSTDSSKSTEGAKSTEVLKTTDTAKSTTTVKAVDPKTLDPKTLPAAGSIAYAVKNVTLLSRQVIQIEVPPGALPLFDEKKGYYYTLHVATPYGVSRELLIPAKCNPKFCPELKTEPVKPPPAPAPSEPKKESPKPAPGFKFGAETLTLPYCKVMTGKDSKYKLMPAADLAKYVALKLQWTDTPDTDLKVQSVTFQFEYKQCPLPIALSATLTGNGDIYSFGPTELSKLMTGLLKALGSPGEFTDDTNPLAKGDLKLMGVKVTPVKNGKDGKPVEFAPMPVSGDLTLKFACQICNDDGKPVWQAVGPKNEEQKNEGQGSLPAPRLLETPKIDPPKINPSPSIPLPLPLAPVAPGGLPVPKL